MPHYVETMAYVNQEPWHGLGTKVQEGISVDEMLKAAKLDWEVEKVPVQTTDNHPVNGYFALRRKTDNRILSLVGSQYTPTQNATAFEFFRRFLETGKMSIETAGALRDGQLTWGLAKMNKGFSLPGNDDVQGYLLLMSPHVQGKALVAQFTGVRVVCWNTLSQALGSDLKGNASGFRMPHFNEFDESMRKKAEIALGLAGKSLDVFQEQAVFLASKNATENAVYEYFNKVFNSSIDVMDEPEVSEDTMLPPETIKLKRAIKLCREALETSPGADLTSSRGTWWGALNAVTYTVDHQLGGRSRDIAMASNWFGERANIKRKALDFSVQYAKMS